MSRLYHGALWVALLFFMGLSFWAGYKHQAEQTKRIELEIELSKYKWKFQLVSQGYTLAADTLILNAAEDTIGKVIFDPDGSYHLELSDSGR